VPNIATAPGVPLRFNGDTHAFVNIINGAASAGQTDGGALNLHLGARVPEAASQDCSLPMSGAGLYQSIGQRQRLRGFIG